MGLPTFLTGAAIGALVVYITKNKEAREAVEHFIDGTGEAFKNKLRQMTPKQRGEIIEGEAETVNEPQQERKEAANAKPRAARPKKTVINDDAVH